MDRGADFSDAIHPIDLTSPVYRRRCNMQNDHANCSLDEARHNRHDPTDRPISPADYGLAGKRLALVHDWLTGYRGGEKCLDVLCRHFPESTIYTLLHVKGSLPDLIERMRIKTSFLNRIPNIGKQYRYWLPLMPFAASWPISHCDMVVSFSHAFAKNAVAPPGVPHVSYCFTPMRYAWHMREAYFADRARGIKAKMVDTLMAALRWWDKRTASRVTHFISNSQTIRKRILDAYGRDSEVVYPPVDTEYYSPSVDGQRDDYLLVLSAFAPYKRVDLAIEACNKLKRRLVIIGTGQDAARLKSLAGPTIQFLGWASDAEVREHLRRCRALLFPGEEDFGIVPVEANACGTPVIAYARGGATETIVPLGQPNPTGAWFAEQTVDGLVNAIQEVDRRIDDLDPAVARRQAMKFDKLAHERHLLSYLGRVAQGKVPPG